jgi:hypothetical protein
METKTEVLDAVSLGPMKSVDQHAPPMIVPNGPMRLIEIAVQRGAQIDELSRLLDLQERWEKAESVKAYNAAFSAFRAEAVAVVKNKTIQQGPLNGTAYAELFNVIDAVTPALSKHGLSTSWKITQDNKDWIEVTCVLRHSLGHSESVSMGGPPDDKGAKSPIQARMSTVTFLERYTLKAICGVAERGDDNDGAGSGKKKEESPEEAAERIKLVGYMEDVVKSSGLSGLAEYWKDRLTGKQRALVGSEEIKRIKTLAKPDPEFVAAMGDA